jgi:hypothetical protein
MWWASEGSEAPQTPQGKDLTAAKCRLCGAVSLLFTQPRLSKADLGATAMGLLLVVR